MTIAHIEALAAGNAVHVYLRPPPAASEWRVLRRTADAFAGPDDPGAVRVVDASDEPLVYDGKGLVNGVEYFWKPYYRVGADWVAGAARAATPAATYRGDDIDAHALLRERIALGLAEEVRRGKLKPASGKIPVVVAPYALADGITFPCVSVHLDSEAPEVHAVGGLIFPDEELRDGGGGGGWDEHRGWLERVQVNVVGVSLNPDERIALRLALKRVLIANLPVFDAHGMVNVEFAQRDHEEQGGPSNAPLFMTVGAFACVAPAFVAARVGGIAAVGVDAAALTPTHGTTDG